MCTSFNIRIYGLLIEQNRLLITKEPFVDELIYKFPGGGLEFGEGLHDCLIREFKEELNLDIEVVQHIFTQENFIQSAINPDDQVLMIYYQVKAKNFEDFKVKTSDIKELIWKDLDELKAEDLTMPTEQKAVQELLKFR